MCDVLGGRASVTSSEDYCRPALSVRPTVCACALEALSERAPDDNYSRVISHFICKIASAARRKYSSSVEIIPRSLSGGGGGKDRAARERMILCLCDEAIYRARYWDVSYISVVLWVETIRTPRAEWCGPLGAAH